MKTSERRQNLKETLIVAATRNIDALGLAGIKARDLAAEAGCAVGAIYNVVADLDELVLAVNARTLTMLEDELKAAADANANADVGEGVGEGAGIASSQTGVDKSQVDEAVAQLVRLAICYLHFAAKHTRRWRAIFEHNLPEGRQLPDQYQEQQRHLFAFIEEPLRVLQPGLAPEQSELLARTLFSAVHGITILGLEEKLGAVSLADLEQQITAILTALGAGLSLG
ncbi:MAG: TetR/AcrR family transcriptional regulator [Alphaproteobacteria bacterium]